MTPLVFSSGTASTMVSRHLIESFQFSSFELMILFYCYPVTCLLYVVALNEYNMMLREDESIVSLVE